MAPVLRRADVNQASAYKRWSSFDIRQMSCSLVGSSTTPKTPASPHGRRAVVPSPQLRSRTFTLGRPSCVPTIAYSLPLRF